MKPKPSRYFAFLRGCQLWGGREYEDREEGEIEDKDGHEADMPELGHGGEGTELVPRLMEALVGKKVIGASARIARWCIFAPARANRNPLDPQNCQKYPKIS